MRELPANAPAQKRAPPLMKRIFSMRGSTTSVRTGVCVAGAALRWAAHAPTRSSRLRWNDASASWLALCPA